MQLNFNNYRYQTINLYNGVIDMLNESEIEYEQYLIIEDIPLLAKQLKELRMRMITLACLEDEKQDMKCIDIKVKNFKY